MNNPWVFNFQSYQRQSKQSVPLLQKMVDAQAHQGKKSYYKTRRMSEDIPIWKADHLGFDFMTSYSHLCLTCQQLLLRRRQRSRKR